jgi:hypothetical protein
MSLISTHTSSASYLQSKRGVTRINFVIIAKTDARNAVQFGGPDAGEHAPEEGVKRLKAALDAGELISHAIFGRQAYQRSN